MADDGPAAAAALEELCRVYWYPIYAFIRKTRGRDHHDAEDLTQGFFTYILRAETVKKADPARGKFRHFLLRVLTNFLNSDHDRAGAWKRGGRAEFISLDGAAADDRYRLEPSDRLDPQQLFDRTWAFDLARQALRRLEKEYAEADQARRFTAFEPELLNPSPAGAYARWAATIGLSVEATQVAFHRFRRRFGALLLEQVTQTLSSPNEARAELRDILSRLTI